MPRLRLPPRGRRAKIPKGQGPALGEAGLDRRRAGRPLRGDQGGQRRPLRGEEQGEARAAPPGDGDEDGRRARPDEGRGDEARPVRLLHRHRVHPRGVPRDLPGAAREAAHRRAGDALGEGRQGARGGVRRRSRSPSSSPRSSRRRSPPPRSARCTGPSCSTAAGSRSRSSTPGSPRRSRPTCATPARSCAWRGRSPPASTPKAIAEELRERVMEELDYEYEAQNQRSFARAYRDHPFIYVPRSDHAALAAAGAGHRVRRGDAASSR